MAPRPTGEVIERERERGRVFARRFRAYGRRQFVTLGGADEGGRAQKAEAELRHVLADVERGLWTPGVGRTAEAPQSTTFHEFASAWLEARRGELGEATIADYTWQLCNHLLPFFAPTGCRRSRSPRSTAIESSRCARGPLRRVDDKTITRLGQILAVAEERDLIRRNPVRVNTRNRKSRSSASGRSGSTGRADRRDDRLGDGARRLAGGAYRRPPGADRHARYAGLRISEATALTWRDIDLARGRSPSALEDRGRRPRSTSCPPSATSYRPPRDAARTPTSSCTRRRRGGAGQGQRPRTRHPPGVGRANECSRARPEPLPEGVTRPQTPPHVRVDPLRPRRGPALRDGPARPHRRRLTLRVYAHAMRRDEGDKERLKALVEGRDWAPSGTTGPDAAGGRSREAA